MIKPNMATMLGFVATDAGVSAGALQQLLTIACPQIEGMKSARKTRWSIDVDPVDLT